jgi:ribosomal protein S18 acetylase RimI-like enzyme
MALIRVESVDHRTRAIAEQIHGVQTAAYQQEARLLEALHFPPLQHTIEDLQRCDEDFLVAAAGKVIVGALSIGPGDEPSTVNIGSLVVLPGWQRAGIGKRLLAAAVAANGSTPITVQTGARNFPALALYRQFGFVEIHRWCTGAGSLELVKLRRPRAPPILLK